MSTLSEIEAAIEQLSASQVDELAIRRFKIKCPEIKMDYESRLMRLSNCCSQLRKV
jgi:hypothetical protein